MGASRSMALATPKPSRVAPEKYSSFVDARSVESATLLSVLSLMRCLHQQSRSGFDQGLAIAGHALRS